ncbi:MAG: amino acid transporter, partial [Thermomicrobiales bacterium]
PRLALGLSGFETGVAVMPLVTGDKTDTYANPAGRIRNTGTLLTTAAIIMSIYLIATSIITTVLIPHAEFEAGGKANGRALAYLAHSFLGDGFGTLYDISTILILWFAGASAMAGLLNIVPRYLPRYGMAPDWANATRPLVLVFTTIAFVVTVIFRADVEAQGGAYATGVLVLITSASVAVTLAAHKAGQKALTIGFATIAALFAYTTVVNVIGRPDGVKIASLFTLAIIVVSMISRVMRSTELRATEIRYDAEAIKYLDDARQSGPIRLIANHPDERSSREYLLKEREEREASHIPFGDPVLFLEIEVSDASDFASVVVVRGRDIGGFRVLSAEASSVPNAIAAVLLDIRNRTGRRPHAYFGWTEGNPLRYLSRFVLFGEGDIAPVTREILRKAEPNPALRPAVHIG